LIKKDCVDEGRGRINVGVYKNIFIEVRYVLANTWNKIVLDSYGNASLSIGDIAEH